MAVVEIAIRLAEHFGANHGDQASKLAAPNDGHRFFHDRVVLAMVARQQFDVGALCRLAQPLAGLD